MIRIFYPNHYKKERRADLFPLLKAFIKNTSFSDADRIRLYGVSEKDYTFMDDIAHCDIVILTMSWNYYKKSNQMVLAENVVDEALKHNKQIYSYMSGDYGVVIPNYKNVIVLRSNGYRSKLPKTHIGIPPFISDPFQKNIFFTNSNEIYDLEKPIIGFCGQTNGSRINAFKEVARVLFRNIKFYLKLTNNAPQKIMSSSHLRNNVLSLISKSEMLKNNFIKRKKYRAGVKTSAEREATTKEFYQNIHDTQYTVCVRGGGNFSVRLYEVLAMGRIPIFINTDCLVPFKNEIDWKSHLIWVEKNDFKKLPEMINNFHSKFTLIELKALMESNRKLWESKLSFGGFFHFLFESRKFEKLKTNSYTIT